MSAASDFLERAERESGVRMPVDPAAFAATEAAKARIQSAYQMAIHRPRNPEAARLLILKECERPAFAEIVEFSKPVGKSKISGLTIRFAEAALRIWGNISTETQTIYEDDKIRRILVRVIDLQSNTAYSREIQIAKTVERKSDKGREVVSERMNTFGDKVFVVVATEDELQTKENAIISKAIRNEALRMLPADLKEEAKRISAETIRNRSIDPDTELREALKAFLDIGITPEDIAGYLGHPATRISPSEHEDLRKICRAISDGEAKWENYISAKATEADAEPEKPAESSLPEKAPLGYTRSEAEPIHSSDPKKTFVPPIVCGHNGCAAYVQTLASHCDNPSYHDKDNPGKSCFLFENSVSSECPDTEFSVVGINMLLAQMKSRIPEAKAALGITTDVRSQFDKWRMYYWIHGIEFPKGVTA